MLAARALPNGKRQLLLCMQPRLPGRWLQLYSNRFLCNESARVLAGSHLFKHSYRHQLRLQDWLYWRWLSLHSGGCLRKQVRTAWYVLRDFREVTFAPITACECKRGYSLYMDSQFCEDVDECALQVDGCSQRRMHKHRRFIPMLVHSGYAMYCETDGVILPGNLNISLTA